MSIKDYNRLSSGAEDWLQHRQKDNWPHRHSLRLLPNRHAYRLAKVKSAVPRQFNLLTCVAHQGHDVFCGSHILYMRTTTSCVVVIRDRQNDIPKLRFGRSQGKNIYGTRREIVQHVNELLGWLHLSLEPH